MAMNQCDGCRRGLPLDENGTHSNPDGSYDHIGCTAHLYNDRRPFPVTDDLEDAPDGAVIQREDGWWARSGMMWYPVPAKEAPAELANALKVYESDHGCALIGCKTGELCGMGVKGDPANKDLPCWSCDGGGVLNNRPCPECQTKNDNPEASTCSCDQRGRNVSCARCRP